LKVTLSCNREGCAAAVVGTDIYIMGGALEMEPWPSETWQWVLLPRGAVSGGNFAVGDFTWVLWPVATWQWVISTWVL